MIPMGPFLRQVFCDSMEKAKFGQSPGSCVCAALLPPGMSGTALSSSFSTLRTGLFSRTALCSPWTVLPPLLCLPAGHKGGNKSHHAAGVSWEWPRWHLEGWQVLLGALCPRAMSWSCPRAGQG